MWCVKETRIYDWYNAYWSKQIFSDVSLQMKQTVNRLLSGAPLGWVQKQAFLKCVSKGFIRGCSSLGLLKRSKYIAVVYNSNWSKVRKRPLLVLQLILLNCCFITYLLVDGSFDMSSLVSCCIWRGFSNCPLSLLLSQSLSSSSLSRLLAWVSGLSLGSLRQKYFSLSIQFDQPEKKKRRKWSEQYIRVNDVSVSKRMKKGSWVHTRNSGKTDFIY